MTASLVWTSDLHLNFVDSRTRQGLYASIAAAKAGALLIGGDIGEASNLVRFLNEIASALPGLPIYFILGNHDFYGGSIAHVRTGMIDLTSHNRQLVWLTGSPPVDLGHGTTLIGDDSWADGRLGNYARSPILLNDYLRIAEFIPFIDHKNGRLALLNQLGDEAASRVRVKLEDACSQGVKHILFLTHAPPFEQACWYEGHLSDPDWLPHFTCRAVGDVLVDVADRNPATQFTVLCGHTHSPGIAEIRPNLVAKTAASEYGRPAIQEILHLPPDTSAALSPSQAS